MEILTYPTGLLIGLLPVVVDLGGSARPARLLLDGRPACTVTATAPSCLVDLGLEPREHRLELVRTDPAGAISDRVVRWINRPGIEAELFAKAACENRERQCEFSLAWAHPYRLDPSEVTVHLDGQLIYRGTAPRATLRAGFPGPAAPRLLTVEASFPDGRTAARTDVLSAANRETAAAALRPVPILLDESVAGPDAAERLRALGWNVRAVESDAPDVLFVVEPKAFQASGALLREVRLRAARSAAVLRDAASIQMIVANASLTRLDLSSSRGGRPAWLSALFAASRNAGTPRRVRTADAVATAGYLLGAAPRPRAVVLVLAGREADQSSLSAGQARRYLSDALVPLYVWRIADAASPDWPEGRRLKADHDLYDSLSILSHDLGKQRVAWVDTVADSDETPPALPDGVALAGREISDEGPAFEPRPNALPPDPAFPARSVYALVADPARPGRLFAGSDSGLYESDDGADSWTAVPVEDGISVYSIAVVAGADGSGIAIGTSGTPARRRPDGTWTAFPTAEVLVVLADPVDRATLYAGTRRGVVKSTDGGARWSDASRNLSRIFTLALAADPRKRDTIYAATAGDGVYRTTDGGARWEPRGDELRKTVVRSLALDPEGDRIYAGTDGGVWASRSGGRTWEIASTGLPRAPVYALALDRNGSTVWAGTALGLFRSNDAGRTWNTIPAIPAAPVTAIAIEANRGLLLVGTLGSGLQRIPLARAGPPAN